MTAIRDLEYMLLFGPPENKLELLDGITPCAFPFSDRATADAHYALWTRTLARWQDVADPPARFVDDALVKDFGGFSLKQYRRPIRLEVPSQLDTYHLALGCFWDRAMWPMQPAGFETGFEQPQDHWDIKLNLWNIFREAGDRLGLQGHGIGGVDISLTATDSVAPDFFFFRGPKDQIMIEGSYFKGVPEFIMEVLSPFSRAIDRGPRKEIYRRAGVPQLWLFEPLTRMIEFYRLDGKEYRLEATAGIGESLPVPGFEGVTIAADRVFDTQSSRWKSRDAKDESGEEDDQNRPPNGWAVPCEVVVGLQHLILLGHAERRREIWNNQSPCFLAFGSAEEARHRLDRFLLEAARWEGARAPTPIDLEPEVRAAGVGRFHFVQTEHVVRLNVDVDGSLYRDLLAVMANRQAWDWGQTRED